MHAILTRFAELDGELGKIVEEAADVIADAALAHEEAEGLEAVSRPVVSMKARQIEAPTIEDARHLVRIHIARMRAQAGRDALCNEWLDGIDQPDWKDPNRTRFNAAVTALDEMEKSK